jgi:hypothetical protein
MSLPHRKIKSESLYTIDFLGKLSGMSGEICSKMALEKAISAAMVRRKSLAYVPCTWFEAAIHRPSGYVAAPTAMH